MTAGLTILTPQKVTILGTKVANLSLCYQQVTNKFWPFGLGVKYEKVDDTAHRGFCLMNLLRGEHRHEDTEGRRQEETIEL